MCLAIVGKVLELDGQDAVIDLQGNRVTIVTAFVPDVKVDDHVLIHAGFAIAIIDQAEYQQQRKFLNEIKEYGDKLFENN